LHKVVFVSDVSGSLAVVTTKLSKQDQTFALDQLRKGSPCCPFCKATGKALKPSSAPERDESLFVEEGAEDPCELFRLVSCTKEARNFSVVYRAPKGMPTCPECESNFDVIASTGGEFMPLQATFDAHAQCWNCSSELGVVKYEACGIRDEGKPGR
jgi:hypothetical protein